MVIHNHKDDYLSLIVYYILVVIAEIVMLCIFSWHTIAILGSLILDAGLLYYGFIDWVYFGRKIVLDQYGCSFVLGRNVKTFPWTEMNVQYFENNRYLFGDSEVPGEGILISFKPISKPTFLAAMTYSRFVYPYSSVFLRYKSLFDESKDIPGKFLYHGFSVEKKELIDFLESANVLVNH